MKLTPLVTYALFGLTSALPTDLEARRPFMPAPMRNVLLPDSTLGQHHDKRAVGWFAAAVIGGVVGPAVARVAERALGPAKRDAESLSWDEVRADFLKKAVKEIASANENSEKDAAVCTGVGYAVSHPSRTADTFSFSFGWGEERQEFDCFILTGPSTFIVDAGTADTNIAMALGENGTFKNGVVTLT